ncbi:MAG: helix-turn-helix domain-containing protein [Hyphococcus sp.]
MATSTFGEMLKEWRAIRRYSQLQLSLEADISARHLSFLESGRARPSRAMVVKLANALDMPKDTANNAMQVAGFAPIFPKLDRRAADLEPVFQAVAHMVNGHAPYPAFAIDRHWDVMSANSAAVELFVDAGVGGATNMIDALCAVAESAYVENWEEMAILAHARLRSEITQLGGDRILERYARQIAEHPRLQNADLGDIDFTQAVIPSIFTLNGERLSLFSTITSFSTVQDVALSDIRVEMMFPTNGETQRYFERRLN